MVKLKKQKACILPIKGKDWKIEFLTQKEFDKKNPNSESCAALTFISTKNIQFIKSHLNMVTIYHELFHALLGECSVSSADLQPLQVEEVCCELVGEHLEDLLILGKKIIDYYLSE